MNVEKAELKIAVATDLGAAVEDIFEAARKDMYRQEGAVTSFGQAAKACELMAEHVNKDVDDGVYGLEVAEKIKLYLTRAANAQRNLGRNAENLGMAASGKVAALEGAVALISKYRDVERMKIAAARLINPEDPSEVELGQRPGLSIKEQRLAEAQQLAAAEPPAPEVPVAPVAPKRTRSKKKGR